VSINQLGLEYDTSFRLGGSAMVRKDKSRFLGAKQVSELLEISETSAYKIIRELNKELREKDKIVLTGKISKRYFEEKLYI
jgi:hypothetical protein